MRSSIATGVLCATILTAVPCYAQPAAVPSAPLEHNSVKGRWFSMPSAKKLLESYQLLPIKERELRAAKDLLDIRKVRVTLLEANLEDSRKIAILWKDTAEQQAKTAIAKDSFWRSPYLWTAVGLIVGVGLTVGVLAATQNVK